MNRNRGFTIIELLVVVSIIALLIGILLPAIGKAREQAKLSQSQSNLRQLGIAHQTYGGEFADKQFTLLPDNVAEYGNDANSAILGWIAVNGQMSSWDGAPDFIEMGMDFNGSTWFLGGGVFVRNPYLWGNVWGAYRMINCRDFNQYVGGKWLDPIFYAPKDTALLDQLGQALDSPGEWDSSAAVGTADFGASSYIMSPAAMFNPVTFGRDGFIDPWTVNAGAKSPNFSDARFPDLKSHMLEHSWLQNRDIDCNPNFAGCRPYFYNHATKSQPVTLFYDGRVAPVRVPGAMRDDITNSNLAGYQLWRRDTPNGADGYWIPQGYDFASTSFHMFTTDGIRGRDVLK